MATVKEVVVPDIGNATDVDVIEISVKPGDTVKAEQSLITLEGDKATMEIPSPFAGKVKELKVKVGAKVSAGAPILALEVDETATQSQDVKSTSTSTSTSTPTPASTSTLTAAQASSASQTPIATSTVSATKTPAAQLATSENKQLAERIDESEDEGDIYAGPGVRRLAREFGVDLTRIQGSGNKNRILKEDLQTYVKSQLARGGGASSGTGLPAPPIVDFTKFGEIETKALSKIKKLTGVNVHRSWVLVPHVTQFDEVDITELEEFRKSQQAVSEKQGVKMTPLVFLMKAVVKCLKIFPHFNSSLDATGENLILKKYFHIGVAVDTPDGLVVPVIRDVDKKGLITLAKELAEMSAKARAKQLMPNDMQGSSFTISSLGGIGGTAFTPIVNMPDVAILGVSKSSIKPVFQNGQFVPRLILPLSLSYDHRVIDGAQGARFIVQLSSYLADLEKCCCNQRVVFESLQ